MKIPKVLRSFLNVPAHLGMPVCKLDKALHGLVRAGFDGASYAVAKLTRIGWVQVAAPEEANIWIKKFHHGDARLIMYVDDFILGCNKKGTKKIWDRIGTMFDLDPYEPIDMFLGIKHFVKDTGEDCIGRKTSQNYLAASVVKKYIDDPNEHNLADDDFCAEDECEQVSSESSRPVSGAGSGSSGKTEKRKIIKLRKVSTPFLEAWPFADTYEGCTRPGKFAKKGARYNGKFMYLDRMTRSDPSTAQGHIGRSLSD